MFLTWIIVSSVGLYVWAFSSYGEFDPQGQLYSFSSEFQIPQEQVFHIRAGGCRCSRYADRHVEQVFAEHAGAESWLSVEEARAMGFIVPATPMVVIVQNGRIAYAGPYATGPFCAEADSFLPEILSGQRQLAGPWLNGNVNACRCLT